MGRKCHSPGHDNFSCMVACPPRNLRLFTRECRETCFIWPPQLSRRLVTLWVRTPGPEPMLQPSAQQPFPTSLPAGPHLLGADCSRSSLLAKCRCGFSQSHKSRITCKHTYVCHTPKQLAAVQLVLGESVCWGDDGGPRWAASKLGPFSEPLSPWFSQAENAL